MNSIPANKIYFINDSIGFSCFKGISKTIDGGKTWVKKDFYNPNNVAFYNLFFINEHIGWVIGPMACKTIDGGETWPYKNDIGWSFNIAFKNLSCYFYN